MEELRSKDQDFSQDPSLKPSSDLLDDTSEGMSPAETVDNRMGSLIVELGDDTDSTMQQVKLPVKSKESAESKAVRSIADIAGALPPDSIEMTDGKEWVAPTEKSKQVQSGVTTGSHNTSAVEQQHGSGLVIEEVGSDDEGSSMADEPGIQLSGVPAVKDLLEVRRTESALESLRSKPESQLTAEDKIWQLAAKGGSTLESDRVELDPQTRERLHERLGDAGLQDKVAIPLWYWSCDICYVRCISAQGCDGGCPRCRGEGFQRVHCHPLKSLMSSLRNSEVFVGLYSNGFMHRTVHVVDNQCCWSRCKNFND